MLLSPGELFLARHLESEWNRFGKWAGNTDVGLTPEGREAAFQAGELLKEKRIDTVVSSNLKRAVDSAELIIKGAGKEELPFLKTELLNDRDFGSYTGENKEKLKELLTEEEWYRLRRGWDYPIPQGENLRMVYERVIPYYLEFLVPEVLDGANILLVAHTHSLIALIRYINLSKNLPPSPSLTLGIFSID